MAPEGAPPWHYSHLNLTPHLIASAQADAPAVDGNNLLLVAHIDKVAARKTMGLGAEDRKHGAADVKSLGAQGSARGGVLDGALVEPGKSWGVRG